jgi:two-component system, chemotaxis family, response regulator WspF
MRIGIANESREAAKLLSRIILTVPGYRISWTTQTGTETVQKCVQDKPDMILMSPTLSLMNGVSATKEIMQDAPCPILLITASPDGDRARVFEAMGHGALDVISIPLTGDDPAARSSQDALLKRINTIQKLKWNPPSNTRCDTDTDRSQAIPNLVITGSSTGGPKALSILLSALPATFDAAIIMAQHVDEEFSQGMVDWLNSQTPLSVVLASDGVRPKPGFAYLGASRQHLILKKGMTIGFTDQPKALFFRPSVDLFFNSAAEHWSPPGIAVLLTGMGRDGAKGLLKLRHRGWHTIAQDEPTSVVYGMPKAARELNAANEILPIEEVAPALTQRLQEIRTRRLPA